LKMAEEFTDKTITGEDWQKRDLSGAVFDTCVFRDCGLAEAVFTSAEFIDCRFESCNMKLVKLLKARLKNIFFIDCKLTGVDFGASGDFLFSACFDKCSLDYAGFSKKTMRKTVFKDCMMKEAAFIETDLSGSTFDGCDLSRALFDRADLSGADFRQAFNFSINPEKNNLKKARFSCAGLIGLLDRFDIIIE
jgi:fluoroquinolone resistance protein